MILETKPEHYQLIQEGGKRGLRYWDSVLERFEDVRQWIHKDRLADWPVQVLTDDEWQRYLGTSRVSIRACVACETYQEHMLVVDSTGSGSEITGWVCYCKSCCEIGVYFEAETESYTEIIPEGYAGAFADLFDRLRLDQAT